MTTEKINIFFQNLRFTLSKITLYIAQLKVGIVTTECTDHIQLIDSNISTTITN